MNVSPSRNIYERYSLGLFAVVSLCQL